MDLSNALWLLGEIYGESRAPAILTRLEEVLSARASRMRPAKPRPLDQADILLITYPDQVRAPGEKPLRTLGRFAVEHLAGLISAIHVLPFYPSSSDDGFSVVDFEAVDPAHGDWEDLAQLGQQFDLMFDSVLNHASVKSAWFERFLNLDAHFAEFFIEVAGSPDLTAVVRPRTTPLLTEFSTPNGSRSVWTTFSADQADLNYRNADVLIKMIDILLEYVERGARLIRLDAVGYIWKEIGTSCIHLPRAHAIVCLLRAAIQAVAPHVLLVTETNVRQEENLGYLGNGRHEAHLAYNFALPPLLLHAFHSGRTTELTDWLASMPRLPEGTALLNVLATHDGIGLNGCRGILPESDIDSLARRIEAAGGHISRKANPGGTADPYELNINYMDALDVGSPATDESHAIHRFITAHAIMMALKGVPAIYFHSLFGSRGWMAGVELTGQPRSINRQKLSDAALRADLADQGSLQSRIHVGLKGLITARKECAALSPSADEHVLEGGAGLVVVLRGAPASVEQLLCAHNVTAQPQALDCSLWANRDGNGRGIDVLSSRTFDLSPGAKLVLAPYESLWLRMLSEKARGSG